MMNYQYFFNQRVQAQKICPEYRRFQLRVVRMLYSLAETEKINFSNAKRSVQKYPVSADIAGMIEELLDSYPVVIKPERISVLQSGIYSGMRQSMGWNRSLYGDGR